MHGGGGGFILTQVPNSKEPQTATAVERRTIRSEPAASGRPSSLPQSDAAASSGLPRILSWSSLPQWRRRSGSVVVVVVAAPTTPASTSSAARTMPIVLVFRVATDVR